MERMRPVSAFALKPNPVYSSDSAIIREAAVMTEYEILDVIETINGNTITGTSVYFSVLTAYLLVAYVAGIKLTRYQVAFINCVFLFYNFIAAANIAEMVRTRMGLSHRLREMLEEAPPVSEEVVTMILSIFILMRIMLVLGAIVFMWQVRHPKTE